MDKKIKATELERKGYKFKARIFTLLALVILLASFGLIIFGSTYDSGKYSMIFTVIGIVLFVLLPYPFLLLAKKNLKSYNNLVYRTFLPSMVLNIYDDFALIYNVEENNEYKACSLKKARIYKGSDILSYKGRIESDFFTSFCFMLAKETKGRFISIKTIVNDEFTIVHKNHRKSYDIDYELIKEGDYYYSMNISESVKKAHRKLVEKYNKVDVFATHDHYYVYLHSIPISPVSVYRKLDEAELGKLKDYISIPKYIVEELNNSQKL